MELVDLLRSPHFDLIVIFQKYKLAEIKKLMDELVSKNAGYEILKNEKTTYDNFFKLISQIYLIEQNHLQNIVKDNANASLKSNLFNQKFITKIEELAKNEPQNIYK